MPAPGPLTRWDLTLQTGGRGRAHQTAVAERRASLEPLVPDVSVAGLEDVSGIGRYATTVDLDSVVAGRRGLPRAGRRLRHLPGLRERRARAAEPGAHAPGRPGDQPAHGGPQPAGGRGVVALEILEDAPDVEAIIVPIGGGGPISGISLVMKSLRPEIKVYGVEPTGAPTVHNSLAAGKPMALESVSTIADGLAAPYAGNVTQKIITACVEDVVLVSDDEIKEALDLIITRTKLFAEPAGAAATAALLTRRIELPENTRVVALLSGGNISLDRLKTMF